MHGNGKVSVFGACLGLLGYLSISALEFFAIVEFGEHGLQPVNERLVTVFISGFLLLLLLLILAKVKSRRTAANDSSSDDFLSVIIRSSFLGWIFSLGIVLISYNKPWDSPFGLYLCTMSFFHYSEYLTTSITSPETLSNDSFLLNHSKEYGLAALGSWIEFALEAYLFPDIKHIPWLTIIGLVICVSGEILRKLAMLTAMENFTHIIRSEKVEGHTLVSHGVFKLCRHPSYAGWFWWSIGTQVMLVNPICIIGYAFVSWNFFCYRITYEEATLYSFFGDEYRHYQYLVPRTGVPLVTGYTTKND